MRSTSKGKQHPLCKSGMFAYGNSFLIWYVSSSNLHLDYICAETWTLDVITVNTKKGKKIMYKKVFGYLSFKKKK